MRPDWPAQCLVCQGRGLVWPTSGGPVCLCLWRRGGGVETKNRQVRREFIFQRLRWICCTDKFELAERARPAGD